MTETAGTSSILDNDTIRGSSADELSRLQSLKSNLQQQVLDLENQRKQWDIEQAQRQRELEGQVEELRARAKNLLARQAELERDPISGQSAEEGTVVDPGNDAPQPAVGQQPVSYLEPDTSPPVSLDQVLRRMGAGQVASELSCDAPRARRTEPVAPLLQQHPLANQRLEPQPATPSAPEMSEGEESIDDYMSRLLARTRGTAEKSPAIATVQQPTKPPATPAPRLVVEASRTDRPANSGPAPGGGEAAVLSARAAPPERNMDMAAMREVANSWSQNALRVHEWRHLSKVTRDKLLVLVVAAVIGVLNLYLWRLPEANEVTFYWAMGSFLVALLWGLQYSALMWRMMANKVARAGGASRRK
jgi:hypothetical protein